MFRSLRFLQEQAGFATAGRILVKQADGSLSYVQRSSLALNAGFFNPPEAQVKPSEHDPTIALPDASDKSPTKPSSSLKDETKDELGTSVMHDPDRRKREAIAPTTAVKTIRGVEIPARPNAPASDDCCMSGCARCVYDLYAEDLQDYHAQLVSARDALLTLKVRDDEWPTELGPREKQSSGTVEDEAKERADREADVELSGLDVSMKTFLAVERQIRRRKAEREKSEARI